MAYSQHTIPIHPLAPVKPAPGATCNGCGWCCLVEPCPLGILLSHRRDGACLALRWDDGLGQYRCGAVVATREVLAQALPRGAAWMGVVLVPVLRRLGLRWIAAGIGCDCHLEVVASPGSAADAPSLRPVPRQWRLTQPPPGFEPGHDHPHHHD